MSAVLKRPLDYPILRGHLTTGVQQQVLGCCHDHQWPSDNSSYQQPTFPLQAMQSAVPMLLHSPLPAELQLLLTCQCFYPDTMLHVPLAILLLTDQMFSALCRRVPTSSDIKDKNCSKSKILVFVSGFLMHCGVHALSSFTWVGRVILFLWFWEPIQKVLQHMWIMRWWWRQSEVVMPSLVKWIVTLTFPLKVYWWTY